MATTTYTLTCLSPVHVGTGTQFSKFDGVYANGRWHLVDLDKVLAHGVDANELARAMSDRDFSWATWLRDKGIALSDVAAYALPCSQAPEETPVREAMKDVHQQPYLPGTSVKGAIRTAVLWRLMNGNAQHQTFAAQYLTLCVKARDLFAEIQQRRAFDKPDEHRAVLTQALRVSDEEGQVFQQTLYRILNVREDRLSEQREWRNFQQRLERLGRSREWLGQPVERAVLGRDLNHDLLRAVQVSDSATVAIERLAIGLVWTYTLRGNRLVEKREQDGEYKSFAEWLMPETTLRMQIRMDEFLFSDSANRDLCFRGAKEEAVRQLAQTCNAYAHAVITSEKEFYSKGQLTSMHDFYDELETTLNGLSGSAFLLNIGWGGGWEVKTVGDLLRTALDTDGFKELRDRYRLGENPKTHQKNLNAPFPHTRRIAYDRGAPMWAMGWVKLEPKEG
jgi:CRISPR-associated protein Csm5